MYTGLKGVQVEIRWGRHSRRREFRQAKMRFGIEKKKKKKYQRIGGKRQVNSQEESNHQNKPEVEWRHTEIQRQNRGGQSQEKPSNSRKICTHENMNTQMRSLTNNAIQNPKNDSSRCTRSDLQLAPHLSKCYIPLKMCRGWGEATKSIRVEKGEKKVKWVN